MMTRQSKVAPAVSAAKTVHPKKVQKRVAKPAKGAPKTKRAKTATIATPHTVEDNASAQLNQAVHVPMFSDGPSSQDLATIVSGAVLEGLKAAGLISHHPQPSRHDKDDSNPAATVQGSVAAVIQDIAGEKTSPILNTSVNCIDTTLEIDNTAETRDRPEILHHQIAVPLASRISDKIQSKIWANEYVDFGVLLQRTLPSDQKYNVVVNTSTTADRPVIGLEPTQKTKRIATIDQWISAFQTFVAI